MPGKILKNKPLVEAILEVKWRLKSPKPGIQVDPHYRILVGRLYDKVLRNYPEHEQLSTASMPDEISGHVVQHRFRSEANEWPLLQVGPGIFTLNDTHKYTWNDFRKRAIEAIGNLVDAYPKPDELNFDSVLLRYIDADELDYRHDSIFSYLKENMKVDISLPLSLFDGDSVDPLARNLNWQVAFQCNQPKGTVTLRFATGQKESSPALIWETIVHSDGVNVPEMPYGFDRWIDAAHTITDDWFFKLIQGELERRFSGD